MLSRLCWGPPSTRRATRPLVELPNLSAGYGHGAQPFPDVPDDRRCHISMLSLFDGG